MAISFFSKASSLKGLVKQTSTTSKLITADLLVIGGGGSEGTGAGSWCGGGGAGGYRTTLDTSPVTFNKGVTYTCTVGGGGFGVNVRLYQNTSGANSSITGPNFIPFIATGGGRGGNEAAYQTGGNGGSSGGGNYATAPGTANVGGYSPVEGYAGATAQSGNNSAGGGGAGGNGSGQTGGPGRNTNAQWATDTSSGVGGYYAGGGGSGAYPAMTNAAGGAGGGGAGSSNGGAGVNGTANTGSGGGGGNAHGSLPGGNGGSGIIIIRVLSAIAATSTTGSPSLYTANGYNYYKFTSDGTITF